MIHANYIEVGVKQNERFNLSSSFNRDDSNYPFWLLRNNLLQSGIELNTPDLNVGRDVNLELHLNVQNDQNECPSVLLLLETPQVWPLNGLMGAISKYDLIYSWNDRLIKEFGFIKINFPNKKKNISQNDFKSRNNFACMIATGGKGPSIPSSLDLYSERVKTIRWFEKNHLDKFHLYGRGWEIGFTPHGRVQNILRKLLIKLAKSLRYNEFKCFRGPISNKNEVLKSCKFNICYENVGEVTGYITEKIFDAFFAGCVPVYWGASNIEDFIPADCYIDRRNFLSHEAMYDFLINIDETQFSNYQDSINRFLDSKEADYFYAEYFSDSITAGIVELCKSKGWGNRLT